MSKFYLFGCFALLLAVAALAEDMKPKPLFHSDPEHAWNRVHRTLYHLNPKADIDHQESLEPLPVHRPGFLGKGESPKEAIASLDRLLADRPEQQIREPLKRAILQRDLWSAFADTTGVVEPIYVRFESGPLATKQFADQGDAGLDRQKERRELQKRLVQAMRLVALREQEIKALPDNLADTVKAGIFPREFDPKRPDQAFLPADLLEKDGPWVVVLNSTQSEFLGTPVHLAHVKGRSVFTVHLRLPAGRKATEEFVKKLKGKTLPALPTGSQTALLRRMLLIDDHGRLQPTALTESLQIRVYRGPEDNGRPFAFKLRRSELFVKSNKSLQPISLKGHNCQACHGRLEGNESVRSIASLYVGDGRQQPGLDLSDMDSQTKCCVGWTQKTYSWGLLQGLWEQEPAR